MPDPNTTLKNWFDQGGQAYARFRPEYPQQLAAHLASLAPNRALAVDVGCGNGQFTRDLGQHFSAVVGIDPSEDQIVHARGQENVRFLCAPAEALPLPDQGAALVTAAQAAHWFNLSRFYREVRRIAQPGAVLALVSYGVLSLEGELGSRFERFYDGEIGPYWPEERKLVDSGYATLDFPFEELPNPALTMSVEWTLDAFLGYVSTWSAVRRAREAGQERLLQQFAEDMAGLWGAATIPRTLSWPINGRIGRL